MINALSTKFSQEIGYIYENAVAVELMRRKALNPQENIYYWQNSYNCEVDFVIKEGLKVKQLIQVCYDIKNYDTKKREINSLLKADEKLKCNDLLILTYDYEGEEKVKGKRIKFIPLWRWSISSYISPHKGRNPSDAH